MSDEQKSPNNDEQKSHSPNKGKRVFVAGPYVGELGWEIFDWQPMIRAAHKQSGAERCVVFADAGRERLYSFADEIRQIDNMPRHESECLAWHDLHKYKDEIEDVMSRCIEDVKKDKPSHVNIVNLTTIKGLNKTHYSHGRPDCLRVSDDVVDERLDKLLAHRVDPKIVLCVRDRELSNYRNMEYEDWEELTENLTKLGYTVIITGQIQRPDEWKMCDDVVDLTNNTTIDDLIYIFSKHCDLAVGGSTGTLHLASRCFTPHLVWGGEENVIRYAETNWFAAKHKVYEWGWTPLIDVVTNAVDHYMKKGEWL